MLISSSRDRKLQCTHWESGDVARHQAPTSDQAPLLLWVQWTKHHILTHDDNTRLHPDPSHWNSDKILHITRRRYREHFDCKSVGGGSTDPLKPQAST